MIDKSDHNETESQPPSLLGVAKPPKARGAGFALFIGSLALFFAAVGIAAGYKHWQRIHDRAKDNARQIEAIEASLVARTDSQALLQLRSDIERRIAEQHAAADEQLRQMGELKTQTGQFAETVAAQIEQITLLQSSLQQTAIPQDTHGWQIAEVAFLLRLGNQELQLSGNRERAIAVLKAADQRLSELGITSYLSVRQQIARDLAALTALPDVDMAVLSGQINALLSKLDPEVLQAATQGAETQGNVVAESAAFSPADSGSFWAGYLQQALAVLNKAVVVREINPQTATLTTAARQRLYQLLQLRVENLRLMAMQKNNIAYHEQIALLRTTINQYCSREQAPPLLAILDQLGNVDLAPQRPDISGSLRQLDKVRVANAGGGRQQ